MSPVVNQMRGQLLGPWYIDKVVLNDQPSSTLADDNAPAAEVEVVDAAALAKKLRAKMLVLKGSFMSEAGDTVDYPALRASKKYSEYVELTRSLRHIDLAALSDSVKTGFLINTYVRVCICMYVSLYITHTHTHTRTHIKPTLTLPGTPTTQVQLPVYSCISPWCSGPQLAGLLYGSTALVRM